MLSLYIFLQHFWADVLFGIPLCIVEWRLPFSCSIKINFHLLDQILYLHYFLCDCKHVKFDVGNMADCLLPFACSTQMKKLKKILSPLVKILFLFLIKIPFTSLLFQLGNSLMRKIWKPTQSPMRT